MPHFCWMCGHSRANEAFSGRGHRDHICRKCQKLPASERERRRAFISMEDMLKQSRISEKNVLYLSTLASSSASDVAERAAILIEIARAHPGRRHRLQRLQRHSELWAKMLRLGIVEDFHAELADEATGEWFGIGSLS